MNPANKDAQVKVEGHSADIRLETDCLHLMSRLEQMLATLVDPELGGPVRSSLHRSKEMIVEVLEFTSQHVGPTAIDPHTKRVREICDRSKQIESGLDDGLWSLVVHNLPFSGRKTKERKQHEEDARRIEFAALGSDLNDLLSEIFSTWKSKFSEPERAEKWQETYSVFLEDFRVKWSRG